MSTSLWLYAFVVNLGIVLGAGLYEARINVPRWRGLLGTAGAAWHAEQAILDDSGRRFWASSTTIPLTLLTLANLIVAFRSDGPSQVPWLVASGAALVDRVLTFGYFIPQMISLVRMEDSAESRSRAQRWANLNWLRLSCVAIAFLAALHALAEK